MIGDNIEYMLPARLAPVEPNSSADVIDAILQAERELRDFDTAAMQIDRIYSGRNALASLAEAGGCSDQEYDTFWASMEVLKPAIYAKPPQVVAKPRFSDAPPSGKVAAELIERVINSEFERGNVDLALREVRDDLALANRGVLWVTQEDGGICVEHLDRRDFLHEPSRYWSEVGWVARRAWMTESELKERFQKHSDDAYTRADFVSSRDDFDDGARDDTQKAAVWEVWSKTKNRVYWVSEGVEVMLDESEPHMKLRDFFPCPRPAYGTLKRRTLVPIPDYVRYQGLLEQINLATAKIYDLLERVRVAGLIPAGGDVGKAVETALAENTSAMFIPVPSAQMNPNGEYVQWLPMEVMANTIAGLIQARTQLFADFDRLSGISDIMRGETEANETLGAQRIKTQYGSVRVRDKTDEIVRLSRDSARIAVELVCSNFSKDDLLEIAQMDLATRKDVDSEIKALSEAAKKEMEAIGVKAKKVADDAKAAGQQITPEQQSAAEQQAQQAQAQIAEKYAPQFERLKNVVVVEDVMEVIKDRKERGLVIDIETDSTVMVDEVAEKQSRNELLTAFSGAVQSLMPLFQIGEPGVKLAMTMLGFTLQPYTRGNRQIQAQLDELIEQAPQIADRLSQQNGEGADDGMAEANKMLAQAEGVKAQAAMESVKAKAARDQADMQSRLSELQIKAQGDAQKAEAEQAKLQMQLSDMQTKAGKTQAEVDYLRAQTAKILHSIGLDERKQELSEYTAASNEQARQVDQSMAADNAETERDFRERGEQRADRQQDFSEQTALTEGDE